MDAIREEAARVTREREIAERTKRIRGNPDLYRPYPPVPAAQERLSRFAFDQLRYPVLAVIGPSLPGKTERAQSLFTCPLECKIGRRRLGPARVWVCSGIDMPIVWMKHDRSRRPVFVAFSYGVPAVSV